MEEKKEYLGLWFTEDTPEAVMQWTARLYQNKAPRESRYRFFYGDIKTGRIWHESYDVIGYLGKSTGTRPILLLVNNARSLGGGALSTHSILRIDDIRTGRTLYRAANLVMPDYHVEANPEPGRPAYGVYSDSEEISGHDTWNQANRFAEFMKGNRYNY